jgi:hypothetical protein
MINIIQTLQNCFAYSNRYTYLEFKQRWDSRTFFQKILAFFDFCLIKSIHRILKSPNSWHMTFIITKLFLESKKEKRHIWKRKKKHRNEIYLFLSLAMIRISFISSFNRFKKRSQPFSWRRFNSISNSSDMVSSIPNSKER